MSTSIAPKLGLFTTAKLGLSFALLLSAGTLASSAEVRRENYQVAARDGVELATAVWFPEGAGPWPCVLARTPYNREQVAAQASQLTNRGYAVSAQDCRGKHASGGKYDPFKDDHRDGYDTVEWIAKQTWSNGKVGMWGGSALGITSQLAATQAPPHLACAYVIVAESSARSNTVYLGGAYRRELNDGWLFAQGALATIGEQVRHPPGDPHWDWREIPALAPQVRVPIYQVGGWFDIFAQGSIDSFTALQTRGGEGARGRQKLVMGPWAHGSLGGRLEYPDGDSTPYLFGEPAFRWFARWLKDEPNGIDREPAVRYYVLGNPGRPGAPGNDWRTAESWPPPSTLTRWHLHAKGGLGLEPPKEAASRSSYDYDPANPVPTIGGGNLILGGKGPMDQRAIGERADYLRFASAPLARPVEVTGRISVDLFVESDAPDTDFTAKLVDVHPDGYEALLLDGILRARYRKGIGEEAFLEPGKSAELTIDLGSTAAVFDEGHRIAIHISSSNDPRFEPNPNTGKPLRQGSERRVARNSILHETGHPSRIILPVVSAGSSGS